MEIILAEPIFKSLQGEGPNTGLPSIFIRFYGCNLCCKWCDSLYAVNNPESIVKMTVEEVIEKIKELNCTNIIFTGGEPSLFSDKIQAIQNMLGAGYTYEIETNGSNPIKNRFEQINISPKLSNSGNDKYKLKALDDLTEEQIRKYRILDNKLNESEWNLGNLKLELDELGNLDMGDIHLSISDVFPEFDAPEFDPDEYGDEAFNNEKELKLIVYVKDEGELNLLKDDLKNLGYNNFK